MTTLLLPPEKIAELRVLKGLAYILAVMITLDRHYPGRAFPPEQVALVAGMDARTAAKQLKDLSTLDRVILTHSGYVLTQGGRALFLAPSEDLALSPENSQALSPDHTQALEAQALNQSPESSQALEISHPDSTHTVCALKKKEEVDLNFFKKISTSSSTSEIKNTQNACKDGEFPTVREILEATTDLFGKPGVILRGLDLGTIQPWTALGYIAHAWDQWPRGGGHGNLGSPAGLIYVRLKAGDKPEAKYYNNGWEILPDSFLEGLGLRSYPCGCGQVFGKRAEFDEHQKLMFICEHGCDVRFHTLEEVEGHYKSMHTRAAAAEALPPLDVDSVGYRAWISVLEELKKDMPRASFDTWVRGSQPVEYDGKVLTLGVRNAYCRDWLESRLETKVNALLKTYTHEAITVRFVVAVIEDHDND